MPKLNQMDSISKAHRKAKKGRGGPFIWVGSEKGQRTKQT